MSAHMNDLPVTRPPMVALSRPGGRRRPYALAGVLAAGLALTACASGHKLDPYEQTGAVPDDYHTTHPITLAEQLATLDIPVSVDTAHLTGPMRANIAGFAQSFLASGSAEIAVVAPSGSINQVVAAGIAVEAEDALRRNGIPPRVISYRVYHAERDDRIAPVRLAFSRIAARTTPCGPWTDQVTSNAANDHYQAYGCATQQNLAAMVENPLDLMYPRGLTPADAARRATVLDKYRQGQATGAETPSNEGGTIATGVGN